MRWSALQKAESKGAEGSDGKSDAPAAGEHKTTAALAGVPDPATFFSELLLRFLPRLGGSGSSGAGAEGQQHQESKLMLTCAEYFSLVQHLFLDAFERESSVAL